MTALSCNAVIHDLTIGFKRERVLLKREWVSCVQQKEYRMKTIFVTDLHTHADHVDVKLLCWLKARRRSRSVQFLDVVDSTGLIQVVVERQRDAKLFDVASRVHIEAAIEVSGTVVQHKNKPREVLATSIEVLGGVLDHICPLPRSTHVDVFDTRFTDCLLSKRHLYIRNPQIMAILKFRSVLMSGVRHWFEKHLYTELDAPILTPVPLYDDDSALSIQVHGQDVFLTQCVGFYMEAAVQAFERVYNMGPSFRGEESRSKRHLMEYYHIKAETAFADLEDMIRTVEDLISYVTKHCWDNASHLLTDIGTNMCLDGLTVPFARITYDEAVCTLQQRGYNITFGKCLGSAEERELATMFDGPFWVTGIPRAVEPFPYCIDKQNPHVTRTADLIASHGYGELLGVAEKIHNPEELDERLEEKGKLGDERYEWIREVHRIGCVPHAAFGMGVERLIRWLLNIPHVRDAIPFPRIFKRKIAP